MIFTAAMSQKNDVIKKKQMEEEAGLAANLDGSCGRKVYEYLTNVIRQ